METFLLDGVGASDYVKGVSNWNTCPLTPQALQPRKDDVEPVELHF